MVTQKIKALDQRVHVLQRPGMYVGDIKKQDISDFTFNPETNKIIKKTINYSPGLLKVLDEALDNAKDNVPRSKRFGLECKYIQVDWIKGEDIISISNDGCIVPIKKHIRESDEPEDVDGVWEPELVFGRLMAGSNFDDTTERTGAGSFGVGVSLLNIFSKEFTIEIHDKVDGKVYIQTWKNNMSIVNPPEIKKQKVKQNLVKVTFKPDFERFGYSNGMPDDDIYYLFKKHVIDSAMLTKITVYFNDEELDIVDLREYSQYYFDDITNFMYFQYKTTESEFSRCLVVSAPNDCGLTKPWCVAFCNGCFNAELGTHHKEWTKAVFGPLSEICKKNYKDDSYTADKVSKLFWIFIDAKLSRPVFTSQTKSKVSGPEVPIKLGEDDLKNIKKMIKWEHIVDALEQLNKKKELQTLKKTTVNSKKVVVEGLEHANWAGTKKSLDCTLIVTEGLSAKATAVKGISSQRDKYGVLPIRGKFLNVYKSSADTIAKNGVVKDLICAMNLKFDVDYTDIKNRKSLNYGSVMFCCDADTDGYHIEALLMGFFATLFPSVLKTDKPFLYSQRTPIIRCRFKQGKKDVVRDYYSKNEFDADKSKLPKSANCKHFKGLGTLTDKDIKEVWNKKVIGYCADDHVDEYVKLVFGKDTEERKKWLQKYDPENTLGDLTNQMSEFLDKQLIKFSIEDCARSIPCMLDGYKESQRKIVYTCFEKNLSHEEIKVAQLSAIVAQLTEYKHGEQNLSDTIINMAQRFVGSNNVTILEDIGQFGSQDHGGSDHASARYIFTKLKSIARLLFRDEDDYVLPKQFDEGKEVEYKYYMPILPNVLFNGANGIGTGYSCNIPCYNPKDIADLVVKWIDSKIEDKPFEFEEPTPWYRYFKGTIKKDKTRANRYVTKGIIEGIDDNSVEVSCLPIGYWSNDFHENLKKMVSENKLKKVDLQGCGNDIVFTIYENDDEDAFKCTINTLKLTSYLTTTNITCFDATGRLKKYTVKSLIEEFCEIRLDYYNQRVKVVLEQLKSQLLINENKMRFIEDVKSEKLEVFGVDKDEIESEMEKRGYAKIDGGFNYLFDIKFYNLTKSQLEKLQTKIEELNKRITYLENTPVTTIWKNEIEEFLDAYENEEEN